MRHEVSQLSKFFVPALLAFMLVLGPFSAANVQAGGNRISLPAISAATPIAESVDEGPHAEKRASEITVMRQDLGCVTGQFIYDTPGSSQLYSWEGKWLVGKGNSGTIVEYIQYILVYEFGKNIGSYGPDDDGVDGHFGWRTRKAVREVQQQALDREHEACGRTIDVDGVVGPQTWAVFFRG